MSGANRVSGQLAGVELSLILRIVQLRIKEIKCVSNLMDGSRKYDWK